MTKPTVRTEVPKLKKFLNRLDDMGKDMDDVVPEQYKSVVKRAIQEAGNNAPKLDSDLIDSIIPEREPLGWAMASDSEYSALTEFGGSHPVFGRTDVPWQRTSPHPYMRPAAEAVERDFKKASERAVKEAARKVGFR